MDGLMQTFLGVMFFSISFIVRLSLTYRLHITRIGKSLKNGCIRPQKKEQNKNRKIWRELQENGVKAGTEKKKFKKYYVLPASKGDRGFTFQALSPWREA